MARTVQLLTEIRAVDSQSDLRILLWLNLNAYYVTPVTFLFWPLFIRLLFMLRYFIHL